MILVDTSVWIDYLKGHQSLHTDTLDAGIVDGIVAIGDLIFLEILQGIRDDREYQMTRRSLLTLDHYEMFGRGMAEKSAAHFRALRKKGSRFKVEVVRCSGLRIKFVSTFLQTHICGTLQLR